MKRLIIREIRQFSPNWALINLNRLTYLILPNLSLENLDLNLFILLKLLFYGLFWINVFSSIRHIFPRYCQVPWCPLNVEIYCSLNVAIPYLTQTISIVLLLLPSILYFFPKISLTVSAALLKLSLMFINVIIFSETEYLYPFCLCEVNPFRTEYQTFISTTHTLTIYVSYIILCECVRCNVCSSNVS